MICAGNDRLWSSFCEAIGREDLVDHALFRTNADRVAHRAALTRELAATLCTVSLDELIPRLEQRSVPCGRVRSIPEALADPQVSARAMWCGLDVPGYGEFRVLGNPIKMSDAAPRTASAPPRLGEHTSEVLQRLGYTRQRIEDLAHDNSIA
jgi:crotonobetainyl-CoA:carnitine CoA-transferase CaiB-like acyl-CoA transferase